MEEKELPRKSVIACKEESNTAGIETFARKDYRNDVAETFSNQIGEAFGESIFPEGFGSKFDVNAAGLYVNRRIWRAGAKRPNGDFYYEQLLHRNFCPYIADDSPLLIITGNEGVGKSTLIRYYFDCYILNLNQFPLSETDIKASTEGISRLIVLYVDLRRGSNQETIESDIFRNIRTQIQHRFENISVENNYAMWNRVAYWSEPHHSDGEKNFADRNTYRRYYIDDFIKKDNIFVEEAIWYLSNQKNDSGNQKYYIAIILDNLDQQTKNIQLYITNIVLRWIGDKIYYGTSILNNENMNVWKVVLPLRPETLRSIGVSINPIERKHIIELGEVDQELLLNTRTNRIENDIKSSKMQVESDYWVEENDTLVYKPISSLTAAKKMKEMLTFDYITEDQRLETALATRVFLENFCNGSIRRFLKIRKRIGSSIPIERAAERIIRHQDFSIPHYAFMDSMLVGGRDHFHSDDPDNDILNLYDMTHQSPSPYSLLVGIHVLYLLGRRACTRTDLVNTLRAIGYEQVEVEECLESMYEKELTKHAIDSPGDLPIFIENRILQAYLFLLTDSAYIDNMAMVTPVKKSLKCQMHHTVSYEREDFKKRAKTSIAFLQQIRDDERLISQWNPESQRHNVVDAGKFRKHFNSLSLPSIYRKAAISYKKGLEQLRDRHGSLKGVMDSSDWDKLLQNEVISIGADEEHKPLTAHIS